MNLQELLREYQQVQNDGVRASAMKGNRRIISCAPTGSGKSIMIGELVASLLEKKSGTQRVVIVLPRRSLVKQLSDSFTGWGINHGVVMSGVKPFLMPRCQIVSIDTYTKRMANETLKFIEGDCLIVDEMHLQFTPKKLELFARYPFVIGFSATPVAPNKQSLGLFYDSIVETVTLGKLTELGFLSPLKYYARPDIDLSGLLLGKDGDWRESQLGDVMDKPKLIGDIFDNWHRIARDKSTVIFASSQSHARHICDEFNSHGYSAEYVDCNTPDEQRQEMFDRVRAGKTKVIVNVGIVSVGIDIPNLECVVLARPTRKIAMYLQCLGRVTRICKGKTHGIVIDHAGIIERLGFATDDFEWSLDGKESVEDRNKKTKEEKKEPKDIICGDCGTVFRSRRSCPNCGYESIPQGMPVPIHQADLKEVVKIRSVDKKTFYAELLGYAKQNGKSSKFALAIFRKKFNEWPHGKISAQPIAPSPETIGYIKHSHIAFAKRAAA